LKNPLITIRGFLGLLEKDIEKNDTESIKKDLSRLKCSSDRMQRLLEELLDLSRIAAWRTPRPKYISAIL